MKYIYTAPVLAICLALGGSASAHEDDTPAIQSPPVCTLINMVTIGGGETVSVTRCEGHISTITITDKGGKDIYQLVEPSEPPTGKVGR